MTSSLIWMPFYWADYYKDTTHLSTVQHGAYILLIGRYWTTGRPLPDDDQLLRQVCNLSVSDWRKSRNILRDFFCVSDGYWTHKKVETELKAARDNIEKSRARTDAARKAREEKRRNNDCNKDTQAVCNSSTRVGEGEGSLPEEGVTLGTGGRDTSTTDPDWEDSQ